MKRIIIALSLVSVSALAGAAGMPFGGQDSVDDAKALWQAMTNEGLVGDNAVHSRPYKGVPPHGMVLDTIEKDITVNGHTGCYVPLYMSHFVSTYLRWDKQKNPTLLRG